MNLGDVKSRVKRQFGDDAGIQITDADITRWVNDAQREIAENNDDVLQVTATANVVSGVNTYNLPADYRLIRGLKYNGNHLRGMTLQDFDNYIDGLDSLTTQNYSQGIPIVYNVWAGQFKVFVILSMLSMILMVSNILTAIIITSLNIASEWLMNSMKTGKQREQLTKDSSKESIDLRSVTTGQIEKSIP
jgi:hypothetical protein